MGRYLLASLFLINFTAQPGFASDKPETPNLQDEDTLVVTCPMAKELSEEPSAAVEAEMLRSGSIFAGTAGLIASSMVMFIPPGEMAKLKENQASLAAMRRFLDAYEIRRIKTLEYRAIKNEIRNTPQTETNKRGNLGARRAVVMHELHLAKMEMRKAFVLVGRVVPMSTVRHNARYQSIKGKAQNFEKRVQHFEQKIAETRPWRQRVLGAGSVALVGGVLLYVASDAIAGYFGDPAEIPDTMTEAEVKAMEQIIPCLANELDKREAGVSTDTEVLMRIKDTVVPVNHGQGQRETP